MRCHALHKRPLAVVLHVLIATLSASAVVEIAAAESAFKLMQRKRVETAEGSGRFHTIVNAKTWDAKKTAVVVCDMWDLHHCLNATRRGTEMAPRMNKLLINARERGAIIIHAPSSCTATYAKHPARRRAMDTPRSKKLPADIGSWCHNIPSEEKGKYPIDQSDGGEDDDPEEHKKWAAELKAKGRNPRAPWKSQTDLLEIKNEDYISDNGEEIWSIMEDRGIDNVILVGVHTNMCVLGRPFGLRQMAKNGKNVVLVRDMTDTMYNPARAPYVSHFTGTDLIVEHIEKWVCPTITSDQILGGKVFRFKNDKRPHLVVITAEREYKTEQTLPKFALEHLGKDFKVSFVFADEDNRNDLKGAEVIDEADVALIAVRRRAPTQSQLESIRRFVESGKPVIGVRTANHAFSLRGKPAPKGHVVWEKFDQEVIGGNYTGHHGNKKSVTVDLAKGAGDHAILKGVDLGELKAYGSLYQVSPLADGAKPLLTGTIEGAPSEPIAWTYRTKAGGKVFYTSLAHPDDFQHKAMNQLLKNAIHWAVK